MARIDTEDEIRRKVERNESSLNFGAYYNYRTQKNVIPAWLQDGFGAELDPASNLAFGPRKTYGHVLDLWVRVVSPRWRVEAEGSASTATSARRSRSRRAPTPIRRS